MAETVKEWPTVIAPELEVISTAPTEKLSQTGTAPGAAIAGGIEEIVGPANPVKTDLPVTEYKKVTLEGTGGSSGFPKIHFKIVTHEAVAASEGSQSANAESPEELEKSLSNRLVTELSNTAPDVKKLCDTYGLKREELGRMTGFSLRALAEWSAGKLPSQPAKRRLQEIRRLLDALSEIVEIHAIPGWLHQPNPAFDNLTPLQVIEVGEIDRLWAMVHDLRSGQPE